jgi:hypothetical protein
VTVQEQAALFASLRETCPQWDVRFCSGYVHGAKDAGERSHPRRSFVTQAQEQDRYGLGYLLGFAVRYGEDCEQEEWFSLVGPLVWGTA